MVELNQALTQNSRDYLQFWVPPILRTSGDTSVADIQKVCKFTVCFLTWPGSVILHFPAPHTWHNTRSETLLDLLW